jgi:hypothetical protein
MTTILHVGCPLLSRGCLCGIGLKSRRKNSYQVGVPIYPLAELLMAEVPINDPKHWRERAEEARTVADEMTDPDAKRKDASDCRRL